MIPVGFVVDETYLIVYDGWGGTEIVAIHINPLFPHSIIYRKNKYVAINRLYII